MESERVRPLAALVLVAMLCALIVTLGMQRNRSVGPLTAAPPAPAPQVVETTVVLGSTLVAKPSEPTQPGGPSLLTAVAPLASSLSSSVSSVSSAASQGRGHRPAHRHPTGTGHAATQDDGTTPSAGPTTSTSSSVATRVVEQQNPTPEVIRPRGGVQPSLTHPSVTHAQAGEDANQQKSGAQALTAQAISGAVRACQDALAQMIQDYGGQVEHPGHVSTGQPDAENDAGR